MYKAYNCLPPALRTVCPCISSLSTGRKIYFILSFASDVLNSAASRLNVICEFSFQGYDRLDFRHEPHTELVYTFGFYHIRSFRQIRSFMNYSMAVSVALALISLHLDEVHFIISGSPLKHISLACSLIRTTVYTFSIYYSFSLITHQRLENQLHSSVALFIV